MSCLERITGLILFHPNSGDTMGTRAWRFCIKLELLIRLLHQPWRRWDWFDIRSILIPDDDTRGVYLVHRYS